MRFVGHASSYLSAITKTIAVEGSGFGGSGGEGVDQHANESTPPIAISRLESDTSEV